MPPLPIISNVYRVAMHWIENGGQHAINVIHLQSSGVTALTVANTLDANVTAAMWGTVANTAHVDYLDVIALDGSSGTVRKTTAGAKWTGAATGEWTPQVATLIKETTGLRGRANRGRLYLPFTAEAQGFAGTVLAATVTSMQTAWTTFLTAMTTATTFPVVASYKAPAHATIINAYAVEATQGTQRRRQSRNR